MPAVPNTEQIAKIKLLSAQVHANMALCHLRLGQPDRVLEDSKRAFEFVSSSEDTECKKLGPKIKLRRGAAYVLLNDLERAEADLKEAAKDLKPEDVEPEMKLLRKKQADSENKDKKIYGGMFDKLAKEEEAERKNAEKNKTVSDTRTEMEVEKAPEQNQATTL